MSRKSYFVVYMRGGEGVTYSSDEGDEVSITLDADIQANRVILTMLKSTAISLRDALCKLYPTDTSEIAGQAYERTLQIVAEQLSVSGQPRLGKLIVDHINALKEVLHGKT